MKKSPTVKVIALIVIGIIIFSIDALMYTNTRAEEVYYPRLTMVISTEQINKDTWIVNCQDKDGNVWSFFADNNSWTQGDIANLLMIRVDNNIYHDEIIGVIWEGYIENLWLRN